MTRPPQAPDQEQRTPVLDRIFREEVGTALSARGLQALPASEASLRLIYYVDPRHNLDAYAADYLSPDMEAWLRPPRSYREKKSVVVIDAVDARTSRLVWRGTFAVSLADPWVLAERIRKAARRMVRRLPVPGR